MEFFFLKLAIFHILIGSIAMITIKSFYKQKLKNPPKIGNIFYQFFIFYFLTAFSVEFLIVYLFSNPYLSKILAIMLGHIVLFTKYKSAH